LEKYIITMISGGRVMSDHFHKKMPKYPEPYWRDIDLPTFPKLQKDLEVDVVIVGGGITGITTAYRLLEKGLKIAVIDAGVILNGTTGHTTAKVTAQHGLIYDELIQHLGEEKTKLYYEANREALQFVRDVVQKHKIECDFSEQEAYLYSTTDEYKNKLENEWKAYERLGIDGSIVESIPFNISIKNAVVMKNQAQYHPLKYLKHLVDHLSKHGVLFFENTTAASIEEGNNPTVITREGNKISGKYVIAASHFPFIDKKGLYFARMYADRSYVVAITTDKEYPGGMYVSADSPSRSIRYTPMNGKNLILISGENHQTGTGKDMMLHYEALEDFAESVFGIKEYLYRWSTQDLTTLDKIPYIGPITTESRNILVATGFRKWGMTTSHVASRLLSDYILERENPYHEIYSPSRFDVDPSLKKVISINASVAKHLIKGKLEYVNKDPNDLKNDEGSVVMVNGQRAGAYRDPLGKLHIVDTTCSHMGCELEWNHGDRTWDCPCHGSRFSVDGDVIEGPAHHPLKKLE